jgi:hypothetical protein
MSENEQAKNGLDSIPVCLKDVEKASFMRRCDRWIMAVG